MADEDIGGIKIGLTADTTQLKAALGEVDKLISQKAGALRGRQVTMTVFAKVDNASFGYIERQLNEVVARAQKGNVFKFRPKFEMTRGSLSEFNRGIAEAAKQRGGFKVPIVPEINPELIQKAMAGTPVPVVVQGTWGGWAANKIPEDFVLVKGIWADWADGKGPPEGVATGANGAARQPGGFARGDADRIIRAIQDCCAMGGGGTEAAGPDPAARREQSRLQQQRQAEERRREETQRRWDERRERRRLEVDNRARTAATAPTPAATKKAADATGEAVASKIQEAPLKTETAPKEKAEEKAAAAPKPAAAPKTAAAPAAATTAAKPAQTGFAKCPDCGDNINMGSPVAWAEHRTRKHGEGAPATAPAPVAPSTAASPAAASPAATPRATTATPPAADLGAVEKSIDDAVRTADEAIDVAMSNIEASAMRLEEMPTPSPRAELKQGQVHCPFCNRPVGKQGLASHIKAQHQLEAAGRTPGGYDPEELTRARMNMGGKGNIGAVTPESTLLRNMASERRELGVYEQGPDIERLIGTVKRDRYGRAQMNPFGRPIREGGLLKKGMDPVAMRLGLIQPLQDMPEESKQALLQDPEFISLRDEFNEAIEVRRAGLKDALAVELTKVAEDPHRSEEQLKSLQEAIADPTAGIAHQLGRQQARIARREELGITPEALTGFSRRDLITALAPEGGERPEGWEDLYNTYLQSELERGEADAAATAELDKALLKHRTGPSGSRKWDFGPDIEQLRALRDRAVTLPGAMDFEGWLEHAVGRGMPAAAAEAMRGEVEATPVGERGDLLADKIEGLREKFGGPDPRLLEEVQRLASGPRPGEDISGLEQGDPRRTGLLARIRRSIVRGSRSEQAAKFRLSTLADPNARRVLPDIRPREMELLEVAGIGAQASTALDIFDVRRNQVQSTEQAQATREYNIENRRGAAAPKPTRTTRKVSPAQAAAEEAALQERIAERKAAREAGEVDPEVQAAREAAAEKQAQLDQAKAERTQAAEQERLAALNRPPEEKEAAAVAPLAAGRKVKSRAPVIEPLPVDEAQVSEMTAEERRQLELADKYLGEAAEARTSLNPTSCPCGWKGLSEQYRWHLPGAMHQDWKNAGGGGATPPSAGATPPPGPKFMGGFDPRLGGSVGPQIPGGAGGPMFATGGGAEGVGVDFGNQPTHCTTCNINVQRRNFQRHQESKGHLDRLAQRRGAATPESPAIAHARTQAEAATAARVEAEKQATASFAGMPGASRTAGLGIETVAAEEAVTPAAQVPGAEAAATPPTQRWCPVCKRLISMRGGAWTRHIGGRDHISNLQRATGLIQAGYEERGLPPPANLARTIKRRINQSVEMPPPELGMAGSNLAGLDPASRTMLEGIAASPGGRESLSKSGFTEEEMAQLLGAQSARGGGGGNGTGGGEEDIEGTPKRKATLGRGGLATAIGAENFASVQREQRQEWSGVLGLVQDQRQFAREVLEENPVRALSVAIGQVLVNLTGRAELKNTIGDINATATEVNALAKDAKDVSERFVGAWTGLANEPDEETREALQRTVEELGGEEALKMSEEPGALGQVPQLGTGRLAKGGVFGEIAKGFEELAGVPLARFQEVAAMRPKERRAATKLMEREALAKEMLPEEEGGRGLKPGEAPQTMLAQSARLREARVGIAVRTAATATIGIVGGTALFTVAMTAFNAAMEHGTAWVGRMTAQMSGFAAEANALAKTLGEGALATGRTEGGIRERFGAAGIGGATAEALLGPIQDRVAGEVASQRAVLLRDTLALGAQELGIQQQHPGVRGFMGNFQPTGGAILPLIGPTNFMANPSVQETMAGQVGGLPSNTVWDVLNSPRNPLTDFSNFIEGRPTPAVLPEEQLARDTANLVLGGWTDALQRGGSTAQFVNAQMAGINDGEGLRAQANALVAAGGSPDLAQRLASGDLALVDANGKLITSVSGVTKAFEALGIGLEMPDLEQIMLSGARQMEGAFYGIARNLQAAFAQNRIQSTIQFQAQPPLPFGTGVDIGAAAGGPGGVMGVGMDMARNQGIRQEMIGRAAVGQLEMMRLLQSRGAEAGVDPERFMYTLGRINDLGQDIVGWQEQIADMQLDQQMAQYNRQVFVAERNIADLQGLVHGIGDEHERNIGLMQKENLENQRRIQDIQREGEAEALAMNQRSINYTRARAGFTGAGTTPAEAAALAREADREADYMQRQQDRNVEIFGLTGEMIPNERAIVDEQNLRALEDALADFQLFNDQYDLDNKTRLVAQNIADAAQLQSGLTADLNAMLAALTQAQTIETQMTVDAFVRGEKNLRDTANVVTDVYNQVATDFRRSWELEFTATAKPIASPQNTYGPTGGGGGGSTDTAAKAREGGASGLLFNTAGITDLTVGEAGTETVAVLRNPRQMMLGGGRDGGGANYTQIVFNNPIVKDEGDITKLALAVEEVMNRRARLYGAGR